MGYTRAAVKGVSWITVLRVTTRALSFIKTIVLARVLLPSQFGAYGVALLVLGFLEVMTETGVNVILIQEKETDRYINSAWIVSIIRGIIISLVIIIMAPFIASFFHSPDSIKLLYVIGIVPFLRGFINPSVIKFQKELRFQQEFIYRFTIFFLDASIAIIATLILRDPLGIIIGFIAGVIAEIVLSYIMVKPTPILNINKEYFMKIIHRGKWVTGSGIFNYLFHNADNIIVGRLLGTTSLGIYQMGYSFSMLPITEIADVFARVTFPVYVKISEDKKRLQAAFIKTTLVIALLAIFIGSILILFPKEIVLFVLGDKWMPVIPILPILAVFGVIRAISGSSSALFLAVGKQEYLTIITFISILGLIIPIFPLVLHFGILGAAYSALIGSVVAVPFYYYYSLKIFTKNERH
ncbi:lipopolysaccharide biosynthesis protein [Patescibacteria group bacterium]|nr:lipopolysaccharide biosynthesis protein [Patescibacteria group bacterium]MBU4017160.1 lipopolysaccharide biosynthesis protein [Patescibacteria group bacterium]MBU4098892.1 lipopolysaccharide biosynthesis protein [Patescibacteria group bacterium]